jgi:hypothetical protein
MNLFDAEAMSNSFPIGLFNKLIAQNYDLVKLGCEKTGTNKSPFGKGKRITAKPWSI